MNYLREFLYRPKKSDRSLMARFFFADEALTAVTSELDSFDGRKDPERCASLVNRLRSCQDKLLGICMKILEVLEPGSTSRTREFRAKYPDDIMTDNLSGQLWFGAECLAAGSSIMNKEAESEAMRPLAKAVTKSLEKVRSLLREQCLSANPNEFTENIRENLKIFDRLFADFEYNYVRCMVHVKTIKEYDLHQDLIVLFSDTLARAIRQDMVSQELVDNYDPSLMFAIPRLAIVYGLLVCPDDSPLSVDRSHGDFPALFLPFKNLLRKIRELLLTLEPGEVMVLEMLLCQLEEPANIATKLKEVEVMLENRAKTEVQERLLQAGLNCDQEARLLRAGPATDAVRRGADVSKIDRLDSIPCKCDAKDNEAEQVARDIVGSLVAAAVEGACRTTVEIDCTGPEIRVSPQSTKYERPPSSSSSSARATQGKKLCEGSSGALAIPSRSGHHRSSSGLKRHNARRDAKKMPFRYQKDRRAKFKSTEDLIHRLYVCISGAADQLQSNYAADFRSILRVVFLINVTQEEDVADTPSPTTEEAEDEVDEVPPEPAEAGSGSGRARPSPVLPIPRSEALPGGGPEIDLATDALQHEVSASLINTQLRPTGAAAAPDAYYEVEDAAGGVGRGGAVYAQNLDLHMQSTADEATVATREPSPTEFYQPEPTLLDIADGATARDGRVPVDPSSPPETTASDAEFVQFSSPSQAPSRMPPPAWVPDSEAPNCMGCRDPFTFVKRRHHCRACGKVFCGKCSSHYEPLPHYGLDRPVRVCNRCHLLMQPDQGFYLGTSPSISTGSPASSDSMDQPGTRTPVDARSPPSWNRNFGMVS